MSDLYLTLEEIKHITNKKHNAGQRKVLAAMGYSVNMRPDGTFWVPRAQFIEQPKQKHAPDLSMFNVA